MRCTRCQATIPGGAASCRVCGAPAGVSDPLLGVTLQGQYKIVRKLGEGGFGSIYEAEQASMRRKVAIKTLHAHLAKRANVVQRFEREGAAASQLEHPNAVKMYNTGQTEDGTLWLAMEFLTGESLADRLARGPLHPHELLALLGPVCEVLEEAHEKGIIHRDLKPENIFLASGIKGRIVPKVLDFGIARILDSDAPATDSGIVTGSPRYMPPEQWKGLKYADTLSDQYSLGLIVYESLSGDFPFVAESIAGWVQQHCLAHPIPLDRKMSQPLPKEFVDVVMRSIAREPLHRFASMADFFQALTLAARSIPKPDHFLLISSSIPVVHLSSSSGYPAVGRIDEDSAPTINSGAVSPFFQKNTSQEQTDENLNLKNYANLSESSDEENQEPETIHEASRPNQTLQLREEGAITGEVPTKLVRLPSHEIQLPPTRIEPPPLPFQRKEKSTSENVEILGVTQKLEQVSPRIGVLELPILSQDIIPDHQIFFKEEKSTSRTRISFSSNTKLVLWGSGVGIMGVLLLFGLFWAWTTNGEKSNAYPPLEGDEATKLVATQANEVVPSSQNTMSATLVFETKPSAPVFVLGEEKNIVLVGTPEEKDTDRDTIPDVADHCPKERGNTKANGCPDGDRDGVPDAEDSCKDEKGSVLTGGCLDSDGDGTADFVDKCKDEKEDGQGVLDGCPEKSAVGGYDELIKRAQSAYMSGDFAETLGLLDDALRLKPNSIEVYRIKLSIYRSQGQIELACRTMRRYLDLTGTSNSYSTDLVDYMDAHNSLETPSCTHK